MVEVKFTPEREANVGSVEDAVDALTREFAFEKSFYDLRSIGVTGEYHLQVDGRELTPTRWAFCNFLGSLGIPARFGLKIPNDLLDIVVRRLREVEPRNVQLLTHDGTLINLVPAHYVAPSLRAVLQAFGERPVSFVKLSDRGIQLATESEVKAEPVVGDTFKFGVILRGSETGGPWPYAQLMSYRLVCSNGAIVGAEFGAVKWDKRMHDGFETFVTSVVGLLDRCERLVPTLDSLRERKLSVREFKHLWLQSNRIVGGAAADSLFAVTEDERKVYSNTAKILPEAATELGALDIFNSLSQCARDLKYSAGEYMMAVAGQMLKL